MKDSKWFMLSISFLVMLESIYCMDPATAIGVITSIASLGDTFHKYAIEDDGGLLESIEDLKKTTKLTQDTVNRISNQFTSLNTQLTGSTLQILNELKLKDITDPIRYINSKMNYLISNAPSQRSSPDVIKLFFNTFIEQFQAENPDFKLVHELQESHMVGSQSLVDFFIEKARFHEQTTTSTIVTSSNKMVYDWFSVIGFYIGQAYSLMNICILIRKHYSHQYIADNDIKYLDSRMKVQTDFYELMKESLMKADNFDDYVSFVNLSKQSSDANAVRMKNVLQNYLEYERYLSSNNDTCAGTCEEYTYKRIYGGDGGCFGELRHCKWKVPHGTVSYTSKPSDPTSRIYDGYSDSNDWFGHGGFEKTTRERDLTHPPSHWTDWHKNGRKKSDMAGFNVCHTCLCTCDNLYSVHSVRIIYSGKMEPEIPGYVITGVRFIEKNRVIFLQIQIGKLLPLALIDQSTIQWQNVPQNIGSNYIEFGYDFRRFSLDGILLDSNIMTGIQFAKREGSVRLQVYGKKLSDFGMGTMDSLVSTESASGWTWIKDIQSKIVGLDEYSTVFVKRTNQTIAFGVSDERTDAGQSFVPYFDGTAIEFDKKAPLSGVGFLHYSNDADHAGYIRPYIMSFRYKNVLL